MNGSTTLTAWGRGDVYTLLIAVVVFLSCVLLHLRAIRAKGLECADTIGGLMSGALSVGPLLMIVADPFNKVLAVVKVDLLEIVMNESRLTLWFSAFLALVNAVISLLRSRHPRRPAALSTFETS